MSHDEMVAEIGRLGITEQILLVEEVWDHIAQRSEQVPIPPWHQQILEERRDDHLRPDTCKSWSRIRSELGQR